MLITCDEAGTALMAREMERKALVPALCCPQFPEVQRTLLQCDVCREGGVHGLLWEHMDRHLAQL